MRDCHCVIAGHISRVDMGWIFSGVDMYSTGGEKECGVDITYTGRCRWGVSEVELGVEISMSYEGDEGDVM